MAKWLALVALLFASMAPAAVPSDILGKGVWGSDGWDDQGFPLRAGTTLNKLGNGVDPDGGTPPAAAYEFTDIPTTDTANWATTATQPQANFCNLTINGGTCEQAKMRFTANVTHTLFDDPIRNFGQPGTSHCHIFFGNGSASAFSTYQTLRNTASRFSAASGGSFNGTAYWMPCLIKENAFGDGKDYIVKPDWVTAYYTAAGASITSQLTYLLLGLRYVGGYNMDDGSSGNPWGAWLQAKIDAANAQAGTSGRYSISRPGDGFNPVNWGFVCASTGQRLEKKLANADGSGSFSPACPSTSKIELQFSGPECWDGVNFWSPGGYKHVTPMIWDNVASAFICPNGWYRLPELQLTIPFTHSGAADYTTWKLASDAPGSAHVSSFHTDWLNGWDKTALRMWQDNCMGVNAVAHECNDGTLAQNFRLFTAESGLYRSPQVNTTQSFGTSSPTKMWLLPPQSKKTHDMLMYGHRTPSPLTRILDVEGDSNAVCGDELSVGNDCTGGFTFTQAYALNYNYARERAWSKGGSGIVTITARQASLIAAKPPAGTPWVVSLHTGTNDLNRICMPLGGQCQFATDADYVAAIFAYTDALRAAGAKVVVTTILPGGSDPPQAANFNTHRAVVNPLIRAGLGTHFDALADFAANTTIGDNGDNLSSTYYSDQIHLTSAGHLIALPIYAAAVSKAFNAPQTASVLLALDFDLQDAAVLPVQRTRCFAFDCGIEW